MGTGKTEPGDPGDGEPGVPDSAVLVFIAMNLGVLKLHLAVVGSIRIPDAQPSLGHGMSHVRTSTR
jgi:hypothetical protein